MGAERNIYHLVMACFWLNVVLVSQNRYYGNKFSKYCNHFLQKYVQYGTKHFRVAISSFTETPLEIASMLDKMFTKPAFFTISWHLILIM